MELDLLCRKASGEMVLVAEEISEGELPEGVEPLAEMLQGIREVIFALKSAEKVLVSEIHARKPSDDPTPVALNDGSKAVTKVTRRRTKLNREGMVSFVRDYVRENPVDPETGEVIDQDVKFRDLLFDCFRLEPRWAKLQKLGMNDEDYCEVTLAETVKIS